MAKVSHIGRRGIRIDRPADQCQCARLRFGRFFGQIGGGGQGQRGGLTDRDHMGVGAKVVHEINEVERIILDVEFACTNWNITRIVPVCHIDVAIRQQGDHGGSKERGIMTGHWRNQQNLAARLFAALDREFQQIAKGAFHHRLDADQTILACGTDHRGDVPIGLHDHAGETTLRHFAPCGEPFHRRVWKQRESRVGCHSKRRSAEPLIGIPDGLHHVVGGHIAHVGAPLCCTCKDRR